ncbi:MAG: hypothetical protein WAW76_01620, partial [Trichococcus flocculiformis]
MSKVSRHSTISVQSGVKLSNLPHLFDIFGHHAEHYSSCLLFVTILKLLTLHYSLCFFNHSMATVAKEPAPIGRAASSN